MEEEYEGWKIKYYEKEDIFIAEKDGAIRRGDNLTKLKKRLKKKFKRRKAFYGTKEVEITSVVGGSYYINYWITSDGTSQKVGDSRIYKYTEKNKKLIEQIREVDEAIREVDEAIQELRNKRRKLDDQLERFKKEDFNLEG